MNGAVAGQYYENYVVMGLIKHYAYSSAKANATYYRDSNAKEIDLFIEENQTIHPLEVKKITFSDKIALTRGNGGIICMCEEPISIDEKNCFIPSIRYDGCNEIKNINGSIRFLVGQIPSLLIQTTDS